MRWVGFRFPYLIDQVVQTVDTRLFFVQGIEQGPSMRGQTLQGVRLFSFFQIHHHVLYGCGIASRILQVLDDRFRSYVDRHMLLFSAGGLPFGGSLSRAPPMFRCR